MKTNGLRKQTFCFFKKKKVTGAGRDLSFWLDANSVYSNPSFTKDEGVPIVITKSVSGVNEVQVEGFALASVKVEGVTANAEPSVFFKTTATQTVSIAFVHNLNLDNLNGLGDIANILMSRETYDTTNSAADNAKNKNDNHSNKDTCQCFAQSIKIHKILHLQLVGTAM